MVKNALWGSRREISETKQVGLIEPDVACVLSNAAGCFAAGDHDVASCHTPVQCDAGRGAVVLFGDLLQRVGF